jgi:hypothetical protein
MDARENIRTSIDCCRYCVVPKRHPGCHGQCPEYIKERAELDRHNAILKKERETDRQIYQQAADSIARIKKKKGW